MKATVTFDSLDTFNRAMANDDFFGKAIKDGRISVQGAGLAGLATKIASFVSKYYTPSCELFLRHDIR